MTLRKDKNQDSGFQKSIPVPGLAPKVNLGTGIPLESPSRCQPRFQTSNEVASNLFIKNHN